MEIDLPPAVQPGIEPRFAYTVGLLLLVMVAALTGLSLRLHRRSVLAEAHAAQTSAAMDQQNQAMAVLGRHLLEAAPLDRQALAARPAKLDDRTVTVLTISPQQAHTVGLQAGDVLEVAEPAATAPPTGPSGQGG